MSNVWFTSDLHFGHKMVAGLRGFEDPDVHDAVVINSIVQVVRPGDALWILGDFSASNQGWDKAVSAMTQIRDRVEGVQIHAVAGNHDEFHPMHSKAAKALRIASGVFDTVQQTATKRMGGQRVLLSHFPYSGTGSDHGEERYTQWRMPDLGMPMVHGHTHNKDQVMHLSDNGTPQFHVGWDAHRVPVDINTITAAFKDALEVTA